MKVITLKTMPVSSEEYYSNNIIVKYTGTTTIDFIKNYYYKAIYNEDTGIYGWEEASEYNTKVFTQQNMVYLLNELTTKLQINHIGE